MIKLSATALVLATAVALSTGCALEAGEESDQAMAAELEEEQRELDEGELRERSGMNLPDHLVTESDRLDLIDEPYPFGEADDSSGGRVPIEEVEADESANDDDFCYRPCNGSDGRLCRRDVPECMEDVHDIPDLVD